MTTFDVDEVEAAFRKYWALGAVGEDWDTWCDECFTEDVTYIEHILGNKQGRETVRAWIKPTMADYGEIYTAYEWLPGDSRRVGSCTCRIAATIPTRASRPSTSRA